MAATKNSTKSVVKSQQGAVAVAELAGDDCMLSAHEKCSCGCQLRKAHMWRQGLPVGGTVLTASRRQ